MISTAPISAGDTLSEKTAFAELIAWAKDRPKWQQDALRRLVLNDVLTEEDIDDLTGICLDPKAASPKGTGTIEPRDQTPRPKARREAGRSCTSKARKRAALIPRRDRSS
jgi:hypothetical protein